MLKQKLLDTGYFIDNQYLDEYIELVQKPFSFSGYTERHHIIPVCYYKILYHCKNRWQAEKFANKDINNLLIQFQFKDHCFAHWLLYNCTLGKLKNKLGTAFCEMIWLANSKINIELAKKDYNYFKKCVKDICKNCDYFWTNERIAWLKANYNSKSVEECASYLKTSINAIHTRASRLNLPCKKTWPIEKLEDLKNKYCIQKWTIKHLAKYFNVANATIIYQLVKQGYYTKKLTKYKWTLNKLDWLCLNYNKLGRNKCAEILHINKSTLGCLIYRAGGPEKLKLKILENNKTNIV